MQYLRIRNWDKYQSIAGQNAPFVRLQTAILLDIEFMCLPDRERLCFLLLLAFAGVSANKIPHSANHWSRVRKNVAAATGSACATESACAVERR